MSLYQRKSDSLWIVAWYEGGKKKTRAFKEEQTARAFNQERLTAQDPDESRLTLGELVAVFFRSHPDYNHETKKKVISVLNSGGPGAFLRDKYADSLSRQDLERMREGFRVKNSGNNTINKYQAYIRAILAWGVDQSLIVQNPWRDFKRLPVKRAMYTPATIEQIRKIYDAAPPWLQWSMKTTYALSLRPGRVELFGLQWTSFDWRRGIVIVRQGKTGKLKTVFPPEAYMAEAYERFQKDMAAGITLVCHKAGRAISNYRWAWDQAIKDAQVQHMRMYDIRHVAATEMLANGADLAAVSAQLGHSSTSTTGNFYAHVTAGSQQRAAALMPELIASKSDKEESDE